MRQTEFESRLRAHASTVKNAVAAPFNIETEELTMTKNNFSMKKTVLLAAAILCILGTSVFAAFRYLSAKEVADTLGETKLSQLFKEQGYISETVTDGGYNVTVLGFATGENLNNYASSEFDVISERTYAVVAVERTDGTPMTYDDEIMVTPLVSGYKPWECNIFTLCGGYTEKIIDGVLYRIIEFNNIEYFADRTVYIAVYEGLAPSAEIFEMNEDGRIKYNENYTETKVLFEIPLDKTKSDPEKAQELITGVS